MGGENGYRIGDVHATLGDSRVSGDVAVDISETRRVEGSFSSIGLDAALLQPLLGDAGIAGRIQRLDAFFEAQGANATEMERHLNLRLKMADAQLDLTARGEDLPLYLGSGSLDLEDGRKLKLTAGGTLHRVPLRIAFTTVLPSGAKNVAQPLDLLAISGDNRIRVRGVVGKTVESLDLKIELSGSRSGDLAPLIGLSSASSMPYNLNSRLRGADDELRFTDLQCRTGGSRVDAISIPNDVVIRATAINFGAKDDDYTENLQFSVDIRYPPANNVVYKRVGAR